MTTEPGFRKAEQTFKKTRIAPTPSGFLHLGNVLSFALTASLAREYGAGILLRIDDLDKDRTDRDYVQDIFDTLDFLGIPWDEGPGDYRQYQNEYSQLHRMGLYSRALEELKEKGSLFACTCSRSRLAGSHDGEGNAYPGTCRGKDIPFDAPGVSWRLRTDPARPLTIRTLSGTILETVLPPSMQDFIVRKKDGFPAYQLASLIDDRHFGVDLVIRGEDLWPSTLAQRYLSEQLSGSSFGVGDRRFYHHPLLRETTGEEGKKLSKSAGATSIRFLRKQGKTRTEIFSLIAGMMGSGRQPIVDFEMLAALVPHP